ncbi:Enzymatic polyprotein [Thelohanellus kitauei]|uniref:Enzymatic polyprotein n=1 Tax=Thelohanellus kitauei TaxID=669202 RepID=A0A0C2J1T9_THEKT|nr:Enzymatic polyprotein [Thelohanellus kitauei]
MRSFVLEPILELVSIHRYIWSNILCTIDELLIKFKTMSVFSKLDLSEAYIQIPLDEDLKKMVLTNTPFGLFSYKRLPYGMSSATAIFQRYMEYIFSDVPNCVMFLD